MDLAPFMDLIKQKALIDYRYGARLGSIIQDQALMNSVLTSLHDGTIDPGDFEDVCDRLTQIILGVPEYKESIDFIRQRRSELAALNKELSECTDDEYLQYVGMIERMGLNIAVNEIFNQLLGMGVVTDER